MDEFRFAEKSRGLQVWEDVLRRRPQAWLAIDDNDEDWPAHCRSQLVLTHKQEGISAPVVLATLEEKLAETYPDNKTKPPESS